MAINYSKNTGLNIDDFSGYNEEELRALVRTQLKYVRPTFRNTYNDIGDTTAIDDLLKTPGIEKQAGVHKGRVVIVLGVKPAEMDRGQLSVVAKSLQDFARSESSTRKALHNGAEETRRKTGFMVSEEVTDAQLDLAYRLFKRHKNKFGSKHSPKILEAIARYVNQSGGKLDIYSPRLSFDMMEKALVEDVVANRYTITDDGYIVGDYEVDNE